MKCLVFGEILWDVYPDQAVIGGAAFNFGAHLSIVGEDVWFMTAVGNDSLGSDAIRKIEQYGMKKDYVLISDKQTGQCLVTLDEKKIPSYCLLTDTAYDNINVTSETLNSVKEKSFDVLYFNTLGQRMPVSERSLKLLLENIEFKNIFCDVNIREGNFSVDGLKLCLETADIVKMSDEDVKFVKQTKIIDESILPFETALSKSFPNIKLFLYTLGEKGSIVYDYVNGIEYQSDIPEKVDVVSTVGAGDCYGASFLHKYFECNDIPKSISFAAKRSAAVVCSTEAIPDNM